MLENYLEKLYTNVKECFEILIKKVYFKDLT
jgi:hypothetical protein